MCLGENNYMNLNETEFLEIEKFNTTTIDGKVIANMLRFVEKCPGFKQKELIELRIQDIKNQNGGFVDSIQVVRSRRTGRVYISSNDVKNFLQEHLEYLLTNYNGIRDDHPLFPTKRRLKYSDRKLKYDFEKIEEYLTDRLNHDFFMWYSIKIDTIRHEAIYDYYHTPISPEIINAVNTTTEEIGLDALTVKEGNISAEVEIYDEGEEEIIDEDGFDRESLERAAKFGCCSVDNVKEIIKSIDANKNTHGPYIKRLCNLGIPVLTVDDKEIVHEQKLIEWKIKFFNSLDDENYFNKKEKKYYKDWFINEYRKMGIEFNPDNTVTVTYTPPSEPKSVPTLKEYLRHYYRTASEDFIQQDSEQLLVKYLRRVGKPENYIALKLEEYLRYLGRSKDYIQNRFQELRVQKYNPQKSIKDKSANEYTEEELQKMLQNYTSLPKNSYAERNNQFENRILEKLQRGKIIFSNGFSLE